MRRLLEHVVSRRLAGVVSVLLLIAGLAPTVARAATAVLAQGPAPLVPTSGRSPFLDVLLVLVLFGAALFAVCRSSRRT